MSVIASPKFVLADVFIIESFANVNPFKKKVSAPIVEAVILDAEMFNTVA